MELPKFEDIVKFENFPKNTFNVYFTMGHYCTLGCDYCTNIHDKSINDIDRALDISRNFFKIKSYIEKRSKGKILGLYLLGGEPMMYPIMDIYNNIDIQFDHVHIITNLSKPTYRYIQLYNDLKNLGCDFKIQISAHTNRIPIEMYEKKIVEILEKAPSMIQSIIYVVEYDNVESLKKVMDLGNRYGIRISTHRMRKYHNYPMDDRLYDDETENILLSNKNYHMMSKLTTLSSIYEFSFLGELSTYYPLDNLYGLYCDITQHSIRIDNLGDIRIAPVCRCKIVRSKFDFGEQKSFNIVRDSEKFINSKMIIPDWVVCKNEVCPMNAKKTLLRDMKYE